MAEMELAFSFVMPHEDPMMTGKITIDNNGGQVRFGINSKSNPKAVQDGFYNMPLADAIGYAKKVFRAYYWNVIDGDEIVDQRVANQLADLCFNSFVEAGYIAQKVINKIGTAGQVGVDGVFGPRTLAALNELCVQDALRVLDAVKAQAVVFYRQLLLSDPVKYTEKDYQSWVRRLNA